MALIYSKNKLTAQRPNKIILIVIGLILVGVFLAGCNSNPGEIDLMELEPLKITTTIPGIYQISLSEIGWATIDPENISITKGGDRVPVWIEKNKDDDARIYFYAPDVDSIYTAENVFFLHSNSNLAAPTQLNSTATEAANLKPLANIRTSVLVEDNAIYTPLAADGDHWFAEKLISPQKLEIKVNLEAVTTGAGTIQAAFWGNTNMPVDPDHHVRLWVNGHQIGEKFWDGQTRHTISAEIPAGILHSGENMMAIDLTGETEAVIDIVYFDWVSITYDRQPNLNGPFEFQATEAGRLQIPNQEVSGLILDISTPDEPAFTQFSSTQTEIMVLADHHYVSTPFGEARKPNTIELPPNSPNLAQILPGAEYIVIASNALLPALDPLLAWRSDQGLTTLSVPIDSIYDQFNAGIAEPSAINGFLDHAANN